MPKKSQSFGVSRRAFLSTTAAAVSAAALPLNATLAQAPAKYRRLSLSNPQSARALDSYKKAIRAMLALPPTDARNWYRYALAHTVDCPHGNWWFLVWHRGYIGWFEQICRELSGDPDFALPYWDWTKEPRVPDAMFDDVLTPSNSAYIGKFDDFKAQFGDVVTQADCWKRVYTDGEFDEQTQYGQLLSRGVRFPDDLWFDIIDDPRGKCFFESPHARGLTREKPEFDERATKAVALPMIEDALAPRDFLTFAGPKGSSHGVLTGFGVLEGQPHNKVHNNVGGISYKTVGGATTKTDIGGFMQANLSPVDPLFFLHHANIDRLWDVWTRKQLARGYPILPDGYRIEPLPKDSDYHTWSTEPFLFFVDSQGRPTSKTKAGDYAAIGDFDYDYEPGSGELTVPAAVAAVAPTVAPIQSFSAQVVDPSASATKTAGGAVTIPQSLLQAGSGPDAPRLFAKITVALPPSAHVDDLTVLVDAAGGAPASPEDRVTLSMVGHHNMCAPVTFTVPVPRPVTAMFARRPTAANAPLDIRVVTEAMPKARMTSHAMHAKAAAEILSIVVEAH
jgi:tyrosinase